MPFLLVTLILLMLTACGGSSSPSSPTPDNPAPNNPVAVNEGLANVDDALAAVGDLPDLNRIEATWLSGDWVSFTHDNGVLVNSRYRFHADGSYRYDALVFDDDDTEEQQSGRWVVYHQQDTEHYVLMLIDDAGSLIDFPMERVGDDGFRLVFSYSKPTAYSALYTRMQATAPTVYPGLHFVGSYEYTNYDDAQNHLTRYTFAADGTVQREVYGNFTLDRELQYADSGTWHVSAEDRKLHLTFNAETRKFAFGTQTITYASGLFAGSMMPVGEDDSEYWVKTAENPILSDADPFVGEFRSTRYTDYIVIRQEGERYRVDFSDKDYRDIAAEKLPSGELRLVLPVAPDGSTYYEGKEVILGAGYNHVFFNRRPASFMVTTGFYEQTSRFPPPQDTPALAGGWTGSPSSTFAEKSYLYLLSNSQYYHYTVGFSNSIELGTYVSDGQTITRQQTCQDPVQSDIAFDRHKLVMSEVTYGPIPGVASMGETGIRVKALVFQHQYDVFKKRFGPAVTTHPALDDAYLFANGIRYTGLNAILDLQPDGTGTYTHWMTVNGVVQNQTTFELHYFITLEDGQEQFAFYYTGDIYGSHVNTAGLDVTAETIDDAKYRLLYNGRTNICFSASDNTAQEGHPMAME